jgi:sugar phosphate permease
MPYLCIVLSLTGLFFVISGIQYWASHYLQNVLGVSGSDTFKYFMGTCITSPLLGAIFSGYLSNKVGGYNSRYPLIFAFLAGLIAIAAAVPMPWVDDPLVAILLVWIVLFAGAFILPIMTGVMLTCIEQEYKSHANSFANMCYNLLGYLPAPTIYGLI